MRIRPFVRSRLARSIGVALFTVCCASAALAQTAPPADETAEDLAREEQTLDTVQVTGSRIPRAQIEGPAPVTVMTARDIQANGFVSVPDVLRAMTQNGGETQSQQSASGADFSPGAQQVDLRGLGPNHTLVLVNGRRIADFPLPFKGRSNFTDISNLPLGMVDRIEVLTGSASAVYGSDAISGVVNFILKRQVDGTQLDYRYGDTERGGGASHKLVLSTGYNRGDFSAVFGAELIDQAPLWAYDRELQDSAADNPTLDYTLARRTFLRTDYDDNYIDPGEATCEALAYLNDGGTYYASRRRYGADGGPGYFCGSANSIGYGTITSKREGATGYLSLTQLIGDDSEWFADVQMAYSEVNLFRDVLAWSYMAPDGNEDGYFLNQGTGEIEYWSRQFTPEEIGGLGRGMIENTQKTFGVTTGFKGVVWNDWDYEASLSHSQYRAEVSWPQIVASRANDLFLGPMLGIDEDSGLPVFNPDPDRLYTPLSRSEYDSIAARTVYDPRSRSDTLAFSLNKADLFEMPAGPVGFAGVVEYGDQSYALNPDPLALGYYYYSWRDSDGKGDRQRWATAGEFRLPLHDTLNFSVAGRYDEYSFASSSTGKFTYSGGIEWRPWEPLLVRGSYGTGFRAPDLHYVFSGEGNLESSGTDYYRCRSEEPEEDIGDCSYSDEGVIVTRSGNRGLDSETSTSWTAGMVWSLTETLDVSVDYFDIDLRNLVQDLSTDTLLRDEADCRLGETQNGTPVDINSPTCQAAIARVRRYPDDSVIDPGGLVGVRVNPINVAKERTRGVDAAVNWSLATDIGTWRFNASHTWVRDHIGQQYPGDPIVDQLAFDSGYYIPKTKTSASVGWENDRWAATVHGQRLSRLPNYAEDGWIEATYRYNASAQFKLTDHAKISLSVTNLFDKMPPKDETYSGYPYYDVSWFDAVGRSFYLQYTHKFGGNPL